MFKESYHLNGLGGEMIEQLFVLGPLRAMRGMLILHHAPRVSPCLLCLSWGGRAAVSLAWSSASNSDRLCRLMRVVGRPWQEARRQAVGQGTFFFPTSSSSLHLSATPGQQWLFRALSASVSCTALPETFPAPLDIGMICPRSLGSQSTSCLQPLPERSVFYPAGAILLSPTVPGGLSCFW